VSVCYSKRKIIVRICERVNSWQLFNG